MMENLDDIVEKSNKCIRDSIKEIEELLITKNTDYQGSVFRPIDFLVEKPSSKEGMLELAKSSIIVRINDKIRRLKNKKLIKKDEDNMLDLTGYLILIRSLDKYFTEFYNDLYKN